MNIKAVVKQLREKEWVMGNGQCGECCGLGMRFRPSDDDERLGHKRGCKYAEMLENLGEKAFYKGDLKEEKAITYLNGRFFATKKVPTEKYKEELGKLTEAEKSFAHTIQKKLHKLITEY